MKIDVYVICYNEIKLAPFAVQYWKQYANKVYVYDNGSNDGTLEYLSQFPELIELRHYDSAGVDDIRYLEIKNNVWKESRGKADYVVVGDFDECIFTPDFSNFEKYKNNGITVLRPVWSNCIADKFPEYSETELVHKQLRNGFGGSKCLIFDPNKIEEINYTPGCHTCYPSGSLNLLDVPDIYCFHLTDLGLEYTLNKMHVRRERMCENNIRRGFGVQYLYSDERITKEFNEHLSASVPFTV